MPATTSSTPQVASGGILPWRPTKIMNMRDLSMDDDFLSHLLVEKLGTGTVPLLVHKMDSSRRLPKTNAEDLLQIVRRLVGSKGPAQTSVRQAVDELLSLPPVRYYLKDYTQQQINAFATHGSRYFELYHPSGSIEIAHTSRYSHRTGKSELCILATRPLAPGTVITELKGSMAHLSIEEDKELKRTDRKNTDIRRDFSVIHSRQMKKNHLFLGPARFVNHDCDNNCELFREGKYITFRVIRPISIGEEITAHYGDGYFGLKNRHCLCETCERNGRGGYANEYSDDEAISGSESDPRSGIEKSPSSSAPDKDKLKVNVNERSTRRGVYAIVQEEDDDSDESDDDKANLRPLANMIDASVDIESDAGADVVASFSSSLSPSRLSVSSEMNSRPAPPRHLGLMTPDPDDLPVSLSGVFTSPNAHTAKPPFRSIISTRGQKSLSANEASSSSRGRSRQGQTATPPLSEEAASASESIVPRRRGRPPLASYKSAPGGSARPSTPLNDSKDAIREESDARVLRTRPPVLVSQSETSVPTKPPIIRGEDGSILPTCVICHNVLPVISVDSKVVWGLGFDTTHRRGRKQKEKQECPRCMRHFAIYQQLWPARVLGQVMTVNTASREESISVDLARRVTHKVLPSLDRKLASAVLSAKHPRRQDTSDERPIKRRKVEHIQRVEMSVQAKEMLAAGRRPRGRPPLPKLQDNDPPKRKRGRPRLSSPKRASITPDRQLKPKSLAVQSQPRDSNGRFGKKATTNGMFVRKKFTSVRGGTRAQRAIERTKFKLHCEEQDGIKQEEDQFTTLSRKRTSHSPSPDEDPSVKKARHTVPAEEDNGDPGKEEMRPKPAASSGAPGRSLFWRPNPMNFARRKWIPSAEDTPESTADEASTSTRTSEFDSEGPVTPEGGCDIAVDVRNSPSAHANELHTGISFDEDTRSARPPSTLSQKASVAVLTYRPSPINFARRRWISMSTSPAGTEVLDLENDSARAHNVSPLHERNDVFGLDTRPSDDSTVDVDADIPSSSYRDGVLERFGGPSWSSMRKDSMTSARMITPRRSSLGSAAHVEFPDTDDDSDPAVDGLISASDDDVPDEHDDDLSRLTPELCTKYNTVLPAIVPWKNALATPMTQYLRKPSFCADVPTPTPHLVHAGWETASDTSSD